MTKEQFAALPAEDKPVVLFQMIQDLEGAAKESQRRILTRGEVFPAQRADQLVKEAWL